MDPNFVVPALLASGLVIFSWLRRRARKKEYRLLLERYGGRLTFLGVHFVYRGHPCRIREVPGSRFSSPMLWLRGDGRFAPSCYIFRRNFWKSAFHVSPLMLACRHRTSLSIDGEEYVVKAKSSTDVQFLQTSRRLQKAISGLLKRHPSVLNVYRGRLEITKISRSSFCASMDRYLDDFGTVLAAFEGTPEREEKPDILFDLLSAVGPDVTDRQEKTIAGQTVHSIGAGKLIVCHSAQIAAAEAEPLALGIVAWHEQLAPGECTVAFRTGAFEDEAARTNFTAILQQHGLKNVRRL